MPRLDYVNCKGCGRHSTEVGELSHVRLCAGCSVERLSSNVVQMVSHSGPNWTKWRRQMAACVGGVLLDDTQPTA